MSGSEVGAPGQRPQFPPGVRPPFPPGQRPPFPPGARPPFAAGGRPPFAGKGQGPFPFLDLSKWEGIKNPYNWPIVFRNYNVELNGYPVSFPFIKGHPDPLERAKKIRALAVREDDIVLAAFPKCGTHWLAEIISMLVKGSTEYNKAGKEESMMEFVEDLDSLDKKPSPRLFNSHLYFAQLPEGIKEKKVKIVHVIRNPKDTAVSWFHHVNMLPSQGFDFDNFLNGYFEDFYTTYGHQFDYMRQMAEFTKANPDHPIINIYYEDMKKNPVPVVQELAKFLGLDSSEQFCKDVVEACDFKKLKKADAKRNEGDEMAPPTGIFRKGIVGDWKSKFTVAQNERFDEFMEQQKKKGFGDFKLNL